VYLFGLTGGIASGKSTVGARLRERGVPVIDADALAREVVAVGSAGLAEVVAAFGSGVLGADGALDRKGLGRLVFGDASARARLNAIVHPRIAELTVDRAAWLASAGEPLSCYEAALLVENGLADAFRPLVVCSCPEDLQLSRLLARGDLSADEALARIRAQKPLAEKLAAADYLIDTSGPMARNAVQTDEVLLALCERLGVDFGRYRERG
jgi:dephospho-CoA kinase